MPSEAQRPRSHAWQSSTASLPSHHHISRPLAAVLPHALGRPCAPLGSTRNTHNHQPSLAVADPPAITWPRTNPTHGVKRLLSPPLYPGTDDGGKEPQFDYTDVAPVERQGAGRDNGGRGGIGWRCASVGSRRKRDIRRVSAAICLSTSGIERTPRSESLCANTRYIHSREFAGSLFLLHVRCGHNSVGFRKERCACFCAGCPLFLSLFSSGSVLLTSLISARTPSPSSSARASNNFRFKSTPDLPTL